MAYMQNIRNGNMRVSKMKEEVSKQLGILAVAKNPAKNGKKIMRQLEQGENFLEMISKPPYNSCHTVSALTRTISERRDKLKAEVIAMDTNMPGHQFSLFEAPQEVSFEQQEEIAKEQMWLQQEIAWLHKCLGICKNRNYFK